MGNYGEGINVAKGLKIYRVLTLFINIFNKNQHE